MKKIIVYYDNAITPEQRHEMIYSYDHDTNIAKLTEQYISMKDICEKEKRL
jgi:hypothetical protein